MKKSRIYILILLFSVVSSVFAQDLRYGLGFSSFEVVQEKRTSLNLSPSEVFSFPNGFSLSFNLFFQSTPDYNFGYVFRIIGQNNRHIDLLATPQELNVVDSQDTVLAVCNLPEASKNFSSFFPFQAVLDIKHSSLNLTIGEKVFSLKVSSLKDFRKVNIIFGRCDHPMFQTSDVPKIVLRDVRINNIKGNTVYYWELSKHAENGVYDEQEKRFAKVENPRWLLNDHAYWSKKTSFTTLRNPQITYNSDEKTIAVADRKAFFTYNTLTRRLNHSDNSAGFVHSRQPNQMIYNPVDSAYYSYCFLNGNGRDVASYNPSNKSWSNNDIREFGCYYWHHNRFVSRQENSLYLFGGYGQHTYKNSVTRYSFHTGKWEILRYKNEEETPLPHYLSGLGVIDENEILLFGGYGSPNGSQSLSPRNYYSLYRIGLPDLNAKKIWEMPMPANQFVVANSMIVDTLNKCFYALCFPQNKYETSLSLARFSMEKPGYDIVSDSIPFYFNDILSYADLFQNKETNELYAVTFSPLPADSLSTVSIYSLAYPPLAETDIYQPARNKSGINFPVVAGLTALLLLFVFTCLRRFFKRKEQKVETKKLIEFTDEDSKIVKQTNKRNKKPALFFFGGFQVIDKDGNDVTGEFTPMLKQLFLIILLNTLMEDGKGIPASKLNETMWPGKSRDSTRNNRAVMISRIRQIFENVGPMFIKNIDSYWILQFGDEIYCDYYEALRLIRDMRGRSGWTKSEVMKLLNIVSFGEMLPNLQIEWIDTFKANFANELIDLLTDISKQKGIDFSSSELIYLADILLIHDILNDDALRIKCQALVKMGKNGLARTTYNSFVKQYALLFGTKYQYSFDQII